MVLGSSGGGHGASRHDGAVALQGRLAHAVAERWSATMGAL